MKLKVAVVVGSIRRESLNRRLARALVKIGSKDFEPVWCDIESLPHYNQDLEDAPPPAIKLIREQIRSADAVLFVTPEYNRSVPGVLKNAIDWVSRPYGKNSWTGKPTALVGATPGATGTAVAQAELRSICVILNMPVMGAPEAYITFKEGLVDPDSNVTDDGTRKFLEGYMESFVNWIKNFK